MINWYFHTAVIHSALLKLKNHVSPKNVYLCRYSWSRRTPPVSRVLSYTYGVFITGVMFPISWFQKDITVVYPWKLGWFPYHSLNIYVFHSNRKLKIKSTHVNKFPFVCFSMIWGNLVQFQGNIFQFQGAYAWGSWKKWVTGFRWKSVFGKVFYLCWIKAVARAALIQLRLLKHVQAG